MDAINGLPFMRGEYFEIVDPLTMHPISDWKDTGDHGPAQGCITVYCGDVRLIDNIKYDL